MFLLRAKTKVERAKEGSPAWSEAVGEYTELRLEALRTVPFKLLRGALPGEDAEFAAAAEANGDTARISSSAANALLELLKWEYTESLADSARRVGRDAAEFAQVAESAAFYRSILVQRRGAFGAIIEKLEDDVASAIESNAEALRPCRETLIEVLKAYRADIDEEVSEMDAVCAILAEKAKE